MPQVSKKPVVTIQALESMKPEEARVLIAQDALELLAVESVIALNGCYLAKLLYEDDDPWLLVAVQEGVDVCAKEVEIFYFSNECDDDLVRQVHDVVEELPKCGACALGTAFLASVRRFNAVTVSEIRNDSPRYEMTIYLKRFFPQSQLDLIEWCFEGQDACGTDEDVFRANRGTIEAFYASFSTPALRLKAIFQNIIDNDGTFKPPFVERLSYYEDECDDADDDDYDGEYEEEGDADEMVEDAI